MNTFIILVPEEYDQYEIEMPYPVITNMTKEQCEQWMKDLSEIALDWELVTSKKRHYQEPELTIGLLKLNHYQLITYHNEYVARPPKVLELNEWLLQANINSNREKPIL
jgi:hypothetical protein